jgi:hypothetical protein
MAYKSVLYDLKTAWYTQIKNLVTNRTVYKDAVPLSENGNYILIRSEGASQTDLNNSAFFQSAIIVLDIVTKFTNIGNSKIAYDILNEINTVFLPTPNANILVLADHQVTQITVQSESEFYEDDGGGKIFRLVVRYEHILNQN